MRDITILTIVHSLMLTAGVTSLGDETWGREYCKTSFCGIMPAALWQTCCDDFLRCCAYVDYTKPRGPFSFDERESNSQRFSARPQQEPSAGATQPPRTQGSAPAPLPQADQPRPEPQQPPSYSHTRPRPAPLKVLPTTTGHPPRSHNEVLRRKEEKFCRPRFCSLLSGDKQQRCCDHYKQCCAYANLRRDDGPFYYEKSPGYF